MLELNDVLDKCEVKGFTSLHFDVQKIVRSKSICERFSVRGAEKVWAYHMNDKGFFSRIDLVFTDQGIHSEERLVQYTDLPKFIVSPTELDVACLLFNKDGEIELSHKNLINTLAENNDKDLVEFIRAVQSLVICADENGRLQHENVLEWFYASASLDIHAEPYYIGTLNYLSYNDRRAEFVKNKAAIIDFSIDPSTMESIASDAEAVKTCEKLLKEYGELFRDPFYEIDQKTVKTRLRNLEKYHNYSGERSGIYSEYLCLVCDARAYYYARRFPYTDIESLVEKFGNLFEDENKRKKFAKFCFMHRNVLMVHLFSNVRDGLKLRPKPYLSNFDGIGLNILHYAIILGNREVVEECIKNYRKVKTFDENFASFDFNPFDYSLVAGMVGNYDLAERINETIGPVGVLLRTKQSLERYIAIREGIHSLARTYTNNMNSNLRAARRNISEYDYANRVKYSDLEKENEKNNKKLDEDADFIDKLKEDLAEVEMQIEQEREYFHVDLSRRVSRFKNEKDRFISSIRQFYEQPYRLYNALNSKKDKVRVVWGDGFFYFNIQDFFEYEKEYKDYTNREEEAGSKQKSAEKKQSGRDTGSKQKGNTYKKERIVRPYGNSWFSPEAHKDYRKLRVEYRDLAKKYHPDNKQGNEEIFKEINSEREYIMEKLH